MSTTNATEKQGNSKKGLYIGLIVLLILLNAFFVYDSYTKRQEKELLEIQKTELQGEFDAVSADLDAKIQEYEALMGQNAELDSVLQATITELSDAKAGLEKMTKERNWSVGQYNKAKKELANLKKEKEAFVAEIELLKEKVAALSLANDSLNTQLGGALGENEMLKSEKQVLSQKVAIGSLLKPENVEITGVKYKNNGSERETNSAKRSEKLRFCFNVPKNLVSDKGEKTILLRVVGPSGSTLAITSQGSGVFVSAESGEQMQYTTKATFDYAQAVKPICIYWSQTAAFGSGDYKAVFYQNGYELSSHDFTLK